VRIPLSLGPKCLKMEGWSSFVDIEMRLGNFSGAGKLEGSSGARFAGGVLACRDEMAD
jgi:hypothetical protein